MEIRQLVNNETEEEFVPITHFNAVIDDNGDTLDIILQKNLGVINQVLDEINGEII